MLKYSRIFLFLGIIFAIPLSADGRLETLLQPLRYDRSPELIGRPLASGYVLDELYARRDYRRIWTPEGFVTLLSLLDEAPSHGLRADDYHSGTLHALGSALGAEDDVLASDALLRYLIHQRHGRVDPNRIDRAWERVAIPKPDRLVEMMEQVIGSADLERTVRDLIAKPPFYTNLRAALPRLQRIASTGGWGEIPPGPVLTLGIEDARVPQVRARLRLDGESVAGELSGTHFDEPLREAVVAFQRRHRLAADGAVGPRTLAVMTLPVERRLEQITLNLERMRWVAADLPPDYVLVDIAAAEVQLVRGGEPVWTGRAVVGKPKRKTPAFRDQIEHLVINPTWTVPPTILAKDIIPKARKNPSYVRKKGIKVINRNGKVVRPESVNWNRPAASFPYTLRQPPGKRNALGHIKFMFPNDYSVYLHDTPSRHLFRQSVRTRSSGCVRVERPLELAELVLNRPRSWNASSIKQVIKKNKTRWIHLDEPLPVLLAYWTAEGLPDGRVRFKRDVYDWDGKTLTALKGNSRTGIAFVKPEPEAGPVPGPAPAPGAEPEAKPAPETEPRPEAERGPKPERGPEREPEQAPKPKADAAEQPAPDANDQEQHTPGPRTDPSTLTPANPVSESPPSSSVWLDTRLRWPLDDPLGHGSARLR